MEARRAFTRIEAPRVHAVSFMVGTLELMPIACQLLSHLRDAGVEWSDRSAWTAHAQSLASFGGGQMTPRPR